MFSLRFAYLVAACKICSLYTHKYQHPYKTTLLV